MQDLPRRDLWLLPLISVVTLVTLLAGAEMLARVGWPDEVFNSCQKIDDSPLGFHYRPNCSSTMKAAEGPWYTNDYNECGYRTAASCGPLAPGHRRIALIGASLSEGYLVEYPNTIGARLAADLTAMCGRPVEVQNLAATGYNGRRLLARMDDALALRPNAVLLTQAVFDVEMQLDDATLPITGAETTPQSAPKAEAPYQPSLMLRISSWLKSDSRLSTVVRHFLFRNDSVYLPLYLRYGDKADFLRPPFTPAWRERLRRIDLLVEALADRAHKAGVPFMIAFVPQQAELALMDGRPLPPGVDPHALPNAFAAIAARHGVTFVDTSPGMLTKAARTALLYYPVDGHPSGIGQPFIARYIAERYAEEPKGPFADCSTASAARSESRP